MLRRSFAITVLALAAALLIDASVHEYAGVKFAAKGNAFVVHGGNEGIYSSAPGLNESSAADSFIRLEKVIFRRPLELSNFSSGSVHAVLFEVDDRETIGGSAYGVKEQCAAQQILQNLEPASKVKSFTAPLLIIQFGLKYLVPHSTLI